MITPEQHALLERYFPDPAVRAKSIDLEHADERDAMVRQYFQKAEATFPGLFWEVDGRTCVGYSPPAGVWRVSYDDGHKDGPICSESRRLSEAIIVNYARVLKAGRLKA